MTDAGQMCPLQMKMHAVVFRQNELNESTRIKCVIKKQGAFLTIISLYTNFLGELECKKFFNGKFVKNFFGIFPKIPKQPSQVIS